MTAIAISLGFYLFSFVLGVTLMWLASRWLKLRSPTLARAAAVIFLAYLLSVILIPAQFFLPIEFQLQYSFIAFLVHSIAWVYVIKRAYHTTAARAASAFGITLLWPILSLIIVYAVVRPLLV